MITPEQIAQRLEALTCYDGGTCKAHWYSDDVRALRSPAPAATVTGWRLLEVGEVIQDGDCVWNDEQSEWYPCVASVGKNNSGKYPFRRRLTPPAQGDAMTAVVKLADRWEAIADEAERMGESSDLISAYSFCAEQLRSAVAAVRGAGGEGE